PAAPKQRQKSNATNRHPGCGPPHRFTRRSHPYRQPAAPGQTTPADPSRDRCATADVAPDHVTGPHKSPATNSNRYSNVRSDHSATTNDRAPEPVNNRQGVVFGQSAVPVGVAVCDVAWSYGLV